MTTPSHVVPRSPQWARVAQAHLATEPNCVCCSSQWKQGTAVQVHHIFPVHFIRACGREDLELDPRNLVTLCCSLPGRPSEDHHLLVGHLGDFELANPASRTDADHRYRGMGAKAIKASPSWHDEIERHLPVLPAMTEADRKALRALMDRVMPQTTTT